MRFSSHRTVNYCQQILVVAFQFTGVAHGLKKYVSYGTLSEKGGTALS